MVKYCNRECQIAHRPHHKKECKKRAAELHDEKLFKQPPPEEDCPICFQQLPTLNTGSTYYSCCGKVICSGCVYAPLYDNQGNKVDNKKCPFCRTVAPKTNEEAVEREKKRMEVNDPLATFNLGTGYRDGIDGFPQDYTKAYELFTQSGELGYPKAHCSIGALYNNGDGVQVDMKKAIYFYELGAIKGDAYARYNLGATEQNLGNMDRALKHYMIAARSGNSKSLKQVERLYSKGHARKEDYTKALRLYQAYLGEIKSHQRDKAASADEDYRYY